MQRRILKLMLLTVFGLALVAAGCGGDDEETTTTPATSGSTSTPENGSSGGGSTAAPSDAAVQAAVESCKSSIQAQPTLEDDVKADLEKLCEDAANGDEAKVREATKEVCKKIVESSVPEGSPARDQALAACDSAAP